MVLKVLLLYLKMSVGLAKIRLVLSTFVIPMTVFLGVRPFPRFMMLLAPATGAVMGRTIPLLGLFATALSLLFRAWLDVAT